MPFLIFTAFFTLKNFKEKKLNLYIHKLLIYIIFQHKIKLCIFNHFYIWPFCNISRHWPFHKIFGSRKRKEYRQFFFIILYFRKWRMIPEDNNSRCGKRFATSGPRLSGLATKWPATTRSRQRGSRLSGSVWKGLTVFILIDKTYNSTYFCDLKKE